VGLDLLREFLLQLLPLELLFLFRLFKFFLLFLKIIKCILKMTLTLGQLLDVIIEFLLCLIHHLLVFLS
jgi:hypothetical protein